MKIKKEILWKRVLPVMIGAVLGFSYYKFIGCRTGSCPITGNPYISTIYGGIAGLLMSISSRKRENKEIDDDIKE
jgi:hypothetical protein